MQYSLHSNIQGSSASPVSYVLYVYHLTEILSLQLFSPLTGTYQLLLHVLFEGIGQQITQHDRWRYCTHKTTFRQTWRTWSMTTYEHTLLILVSEGIKSRKGMRSILQNAGQPREWTLFPCGMYRCERCEQVELNDHLLCSVGMAFLLQINCM